MSGPGFKCPECGRLSSEGWEIVVSEYNVAWGATCKQHGEWRDST